MRPAWLPDSSSTTSKLPPAENAFPAPRTITARTSGSRSIARNTSGRSAWTRASTALRFGPSKIDFEHARLVAFEAQREAFVAVRHGGNSLPGVVLSVAGSGCDYSSSRGDRSIALASSSVLRHSSCRGRSRNCAPRAVPRCGRFRGKASIPLHGTTRGSSLTRLAPRPTISTTFRRACHDPRPRNPRHPARQHRALRARAARTQRAARGRNRRDPGRHRRGHEGDGAVRTRRSPKLTAASNSPWRRKSSSPSSSAGPRRRSAR